MSLTRGKAVHYMLEHASRPRTNVLPKNCNIFRYFKYLDEQYLSKDKIYDRITTEVIDIWSKRECSYNFTKLG